MTCKDCIHYEVCERKDGTSTYILESPSLMETKEINFINCGNFKDKSKFIELPCKVGDNGDMIKIFESIANAMTNFVQRLKENKENEN